MQGTAVRVRDAPPPADGRPWTTYLAGQRLAKSIEAGYAPVSHRRHGGLGPGLGLLHHRVPDRGDHRRSGGTRPPGAEIEQMAKAHMAVRRLARQQVRAQLGGDSLHGASMITTERELGQGDAELQCILRGNRVRRFKKFDPMPVPRPTVRLL